MGTVYSRLNLREGRSIKDWWHAKVPVREMARALESICPPMRAFLDAPRCCFETRGNGQSSACKGS